MNERQSQWWTQLKQLRKGDPKNIQAWTGFEPITPAMPVQCFTNWAIKPTGSWSSSSQLNDSALLRILQIPKTTSFPCVCIAEVMGSNPVQTWIFSRLSLRRCLLWSACMRIVRGFSSVKTCRGGTWLLIFSIKEFLSWLKEMMMMRAYTSEHLVEV